MSLALAIPAAVALAVIPATLISVLFERGAFDAEDTAATALACAVYGLGLPAFVMQKVVQPLYFAREDTKRPFYFALVALVVNAVVAVGLAPVIGYIAAAIGTTVAGWAMLLLLWRGSRGMGEAAHLDSRFAGRFWRILGASAIMGFALWGAEAALSSMLDAAGLRFAGLAALVVFGLGVYGVAGLALGAFRLGELKSAFRR